MALIAVKSTVIYRRPSSQTGIEPPVHRCSRVLHFYFASTWLAIQASLRVQLLFNTGRALDCVSDMYDNGFGKTILPARRPFGSRALPEFLFSFHAFRASLFAVQVFRILLVTATVIKHAAVDKTHFDLRLVPVLIFESCGDVARPVVINEVVRR